MVTTIKLLAIMGVLLIIWLGGTALVIGMKKRREAEKSEFIFDVCCEKCYTEYNVSVHQFLKSKTKKKVTMTIPKFHDGVIEHTPSHRYLAKTFYCPNCKKKHFAMIENYAVYEKQQRPAAFAFAAKLIGLWIIGGGVIIGVFMILLKVIK